MTIINFPVQDAAAEAALQAIEQNQPALNGDGGALAHVTNFPPTQAVSATALPLPTGAAADGTDGTGITPPAGAAGIRGWLSGIFKAVTGTLSVSASALPLPTGAAADVTLTSGAQKAQITVLPALPAGANAIGSVSVSNLPATQPVSGSVSVSNLPATQAVSATALPLPTGAAIETGGNLATIAGAQGAGGTSITQPTGGSGLLGWLSGIYKAVTGTLAISAAALPLPAGAAADATLTNGNQKAQIVPAFTPTANSLAGVCTAAGTDYTALPANASRRFLMIFNTSASASISVSMVGLTTATNAPLIPLGAGQGLILDIAVPNTTVHVQSATAGATYSIVEG